MPSIEIRKLTTGDKNSLEAFLLKHIDSSMFMLGNMHNVGLTYTSQIYSGTYAAAFDNNKIIAAAAHYWNGNIMMQGSDHLDRVVRLTLRESGRPVKGVIGLTEQVNIVVSAIALELTDTNVQANEMEWLYSLKLDQLVIPQPLQSGAVIARRIEKRDIDQIAQWRIAYNIEAIGAKNSPTLRTNCYSAIKHACKEGRIWVAETDRQLLATSAFNAQIPQAVQIGGVYTPPELRARNYARCAVAQSLIDARNEGATTAILFTPKTNTPAQKAYESLGFKRVGTYRMLLLK